MSTLIEMELPELYYTEDGLMAGAISILGVPHHVYAIKTVTGGWEKHGAGQRIPDNGHLNDFWDRLMDWIEPDRPMQMVRNIQGEEGDWVIVMYPFCE